MTVAELRLYSYGIDRTRGDIPIFATAAAEAAAGGGSGVTAPSLVFSSVKVRRDPYPQTIEVSIDASSMGTLELCDTAVIRIGSVDRWYFITGYEEVTNSAYPNSSTNRMNIRISLEYIPITTGLSLASTVDLIPERMPSATPRMIQNWTESILMKATPATALPRLPKCPIVKRGNVSVTKNVQPFWCEVIYTNSDIIHRVGLFLSPYYDDSVVTPYKSESLMAGYNLNLSQIDLYPSLTMVMNSPSYLGITGTITDINISEFCPYETIIATSENPYEQYIRIKNRAETELIPTQTFTTGIYHYYAYNMDNWSLDHFGSGSNDAYYPKTNEGTMTFTFSEFEKHNGNLILKDSMRNNVYNLSKELMSTSITADYRCYSDTSNIYITLAFGEFQTTMAGYKIPWSTSMWEQYRAYNLQYDRQALQNNIDMVNRDVEIALTDSAANGIIGGAIGGAVGGGGAVGAGLGLITGISSFASSAVSADIKRNQQIDKLRREQRLTEQRMRNGQATMNNTSYGFNVINMVNKFGGSEFIFQLPADFTETEFNAQTALWGYPSNKVKQDTVALTAGYWKGRILNFTSTMNNTSAGELSDLMVRQFDDGVRLKQVS